ncbi:MAG: nicotinate-nucleotide adenylyltransferase [Gammaproteobacteria bacterium]|nr:nicotinate-nucleotide adenylyltransferase [Gammaproteobacteria bacterium]
MAATGIYGGTFDPVHIGHLRTALELLQALALTEIRFIPASEPPHREPTQAPAAVRMRMLEAALAGQPGFVLDDRELQRQGPSYTVDTLESLRAEQPQRSLALILGMDAFAGLMDWHRWEQLFDHAHLIVMHRPGASLPTEGEIGQLITDRGITDPARLASGTGHILEWAVTSLDVSASAIRRLVAAGEDPRFLVPDAVRDIILESGCYEDAGAALVHGGHA